MTLVPDQTQPVVRNPNALIQSSKYSNPAVASNVKNISSNPLALSDAMVPSTEQPFTDPTNLPVSSVSTALAKRRLTSPGEMSPGSTDYTNRPTITVVKTTTINAKSVEVPVGTYNDWFLSQVQEQDVERTDVTETFGSPHIFTSGRFTRKVTFSGVVRTTAHNFDSQNAIDRVPQHVLLRNFYESFLRATAQAQMNYYTRITVDGDIYEGYIINLQLPRDAGVEQTMQFALTMICVRRSNIHDADALASLSKFVTASNAQLAPSFASAEMKDAVGDFKLTLSVGNTTSDTSASVNTGKVNQDGTFSGVSPVITLNASYSGQIVTVDGDGLEEWTLKYADGTPVSGTASRGGAQPVTLVLSSFAKLVDAGKDTNGQTALSLTLSAIGKQGPTLRISSVTSDAPTLIMTALVATLSNGAVFNGVLNTNADATATMLNARAAAANPSSNTWTITFDVLVSLATFDKAPLPAGAIGTPSSVANLTGVGFVTPKRGGSVSGVPYDLSIAGSGLDTSGMSISSPDPTKLLFSGLKITFNTDLNVTNVNPFALADSISLDAQISISLQSYDHFIAQLHFSLDMGKPVLIDSLFDRFTSNKFSVTAGSVADSSKGIQGVYTGTLSLEKSASATSFNLSGLDYQQFLAASTISLQYNQGLVACRLYQSSSAQLNIKGGTQQFDVSVTADTSAPDVVTITITFKAPAGLSTADIANVLSSALSGSLSFPAVYQLAAIPITFK